MRRNLPPQAEPWGRDVDERLRALENQGSRTDLETLNALKGVNSTLRVISEQIETITEVQQGLQAAVGRIDQQQEQLAEQQASLQSAVNQIEALALNQVTGATAANGTPSAIPIATGGTYAPATVTVPAGYTRAVVSVVSTITLTGSDPAVSVRCVINGEYGAAIPVLGSITNSSSASGAVGHARTVTGLTGGSVVSGGLNVQTLWSGSAAHITNTMTVIFLK